MSGKVERSMAFATSITVAGWRTSLSMAWAGAGDSAGGAVACFSAAVLLDTGATSAPDGCTGAEVSLGVAIADCGFCSVTTGFAPQPLTSSRKPRSAKQYN